MLEFLDQHDNKVSLSFKKGAVFDRAQTCYCHLPLPRQVAIDQSSAAGT